MYSRWRIYGIIYTVVMCFTCSRQSLAIRTCFMADARSRGIVSVFRCVLACSARVYAAALYSHAGTKSAAVLVIKQGKGGGAPTYTHKPIQTIELYLYAYYTCFVSQSSREDDSGKMPGNGCKCVWGWRVSGRVEGNTHVLRRRPRRRRKASVRTARAPSAAHANERRARRDRQH